MSDELNPYPGNLKHHRVDPLLSDEQVMDARAWPPEEVRHYYEAARAKDAELIQRLVDVIDHFRPSKSLKDGDVERYWANGGESPTEVLLAAASEGFKPTDR